MGFMVNNDKPIHVYSAASWTNQVGYIILTAR